ncbi:MAG TPA: YcjF family protein [Pirellulales bacterium]|nr:YcjF family protein [Pirellulales bacterium]
MTMTNRPLTRRLLEEREHLRELGSHVHAAAREQLSKYMEQYALDDTGQREFLKRWGLPDGDLDMMKRKRSDLLGAGNLQDSKAWQESFEKCFLKPLDTAADKIIRDNALLTAAKTAICPFALLDIAVVIYRGTTMLGSLCRVYQLRTGPLDMLYLFALVMGQAFFAGEAEEHGEEIASSLTDAVPNALHGVGISALDWVPFGNLADKAGQGVANFLLINRIGRTACNMLRPLSAA